MNGFYNAGFSNEVTILGSRYTPPALGQRAVNLTNGLVTLQDGNLSAMITNEFLLSTNNKVTLASTDNLIKLTVTPRTGRCGWNPIRLPHQRRALIPALPRAQNPQTRIRKP